MYEGLIKIVILVLQRGRVVKNLPLNVKNGHSQINASLYSMFRSQNVGFVWIVIDELNFQSDVVKISNQNSKIQI